MKITITVEGAEGIPDGEYVITDPDDCYIQTDEFVFRDGRPPEKKGPTIMTINGVLASAPKGVIVEGS